MAKPILISIPVFDASIGTTAYFKTTSIATIESYQYFIYDSTNNSEICSHTGVPGEYTEANGYEYTIYPDSGLINRSRNYYIRLSIKSSGEEDYGDQSDSMIIWCKSKPSLIFSSLSTSEENIISTTTILLGLSYVYNQQENETLSSYKYYVYNSSKSLVSESETFYGNATATFSVYGLDNRSTYYVRGTGTTKNGYSLDTGYIEILTNFYTSSESSSYLQCINNYDDGTISVSSHIIDLEGTPNGDISYVQNENGYSVDLSNGQEVTFELPYQFDAYNTNNHALKIKVKPEPYKEIMSIVFDQDGTIYNGYVYVNVRSFTDYEDINEKIYATLKITHGESGYASDEIYFINSNYLNYREDLGYVIISIVHKNDLYDIKIKEVSA